MTQTFTEILPTDTVGDSLDPIKDRDQAAKTNFCGTDFPSVTADDIGMPVVIIKTVNGITQKRVYRLVGYEDQQPEWMLERDLTKGLAYSNSGTDITVPGTYQEANTLLTSLAELTSTRGQDNSNSIPYTSARNTFSWTEITEAARTLLAAASKADQRNVLGLGSLATKSSVTGSDIASRTVTLANLATGPANTVISYNASGVPTTISTPQGVPVGTVLMWTSSTLPDSTYIFLQGQQLSKTTYSALWAHASASNNIVSNATDWANRPGSFYNVDTNTFKVPDLRNYFVRAWDGPTGPTRTIGHKQGDAIRNLTGTFPSVDEQNWPNKSQTDGVFSQERYASSYFQTGGPDTWLRWIKMDASRQTPTANEVRPMNIVFPFIMKAKAVA